MGKTIETILTADSSQLRTEFARAEKMTADYERKVAQSQSLAKSAALDNVRALQLEATGRKAAAEAMRQEITLKAEARRLSAAAGISEQGAIGILRRKLELETRIAEQKARTGRIAGGGVALPEAPLTPKYLQTIEKGAAQTAELRRQTIAAGRAGGNGAMGFLAFSQAVEDAQYGIRGVLNNIPQMVMGFGGTMGLAGAFSLAAVAGVALYPVLKRLYGAADTERIEKAAKSWGEVFDAGVKAAAQASRERQIAAEINDFLTERRSLTWDQVSLQGGMIANLEREAQIRSEAATLAGELAAAEERIAAAKGQATGYFSEGGRSREMQQLKEDLATRQAIADAAFEESERLRKNRERLSEGYAGEIEAQSRAIEELTRDLAGAQANIAAAAKEMEDEGLKSSERGAIGRDKAKSKDAESRITRELELLKAQRDALRALAEQQETEARAGQQAMSEKLRGAAEEVQALEKIIIQREKLYALQREAERAEKAAAAEKKKNAELETARKKAEEEAKRAAETAKSQQAARTAFAQDMAVLGLQAQGRADAAKALEKEISLRREAVDMAEKMGITEEQALEALRKREALLRRGEEAERPGGRRSNISRPGGSRTDFARGNNTDFARGNNTDFSRGNRVGFAREQMGLRDAAAAKALLKDPAAKDRAAAATYYEKSLESQQQLVAIFNKLGVA